jgi:hypothetical protein
MPPRVDILDDGVQWYAPNGLFNRLQSVRGRGDFYKNLKGLQREILKAQVRAMRRGALMMQDTARNTVAYNDDTGATRASTFAFVQNFTRDEVPSLYENIADAINPGYGISTVRAVYTSDEDFESPEAGDPAIILSTGTSYTRWLETAYGGHNAFLGPTIDEEGPAVYALVVEYIRRAIARFDLRAGASQDV